MKRFIDLRGQICLDDDLPIDQQEIAFAFYCTSVDQFESFDGSQVFYSWDDFESYYKTSKPGSHSPIERYKGLCPDWVFIEEPNCVERS